MGSNVSIVRKNSIVVRLAAGEAYTEHCGKRDEVSRREKEELN